MFMFPDADLGMSSTAEDYSLEAFLFTSLSGIGHMLYLRAQACLSDLRASHIWTVS